MSKYVLNNAREDAGEGKVPKSPEEKCMDSNGQFVSDDFLKNLFGNNNLTDFEEHRHQIRKVVEFAQPKLAKPRDISKIPGIVDRRVKDKTVTETKRETASQLTLEASFRAPVLFEIFESELQAYLLESGHDPSICTYVVCEDPTGPEPPILFDHEKYRAHSGREFPFQIGGLGGLPHGGRAGLQSIVNQCPNGGRVVLVHGTHIGIDDRGSLGSCNIHDRRTDVFLKVRSCAAVMEMYERMVRLGATALDALGGPKHECDLRDLHKALRPYLSKLETATESLRRTIAVAEATRKTAEESNAEAARREKDKEVTLEEIIFAKERAEEDNGAATEAAAAAHIAKENHAVALREAKSNEAYIGLPNFMYQEQRQRLLDIAKDAVDCKAIVIGYIRICMPPSEDDRVIVVNMDLVKPSSERSGASGWLISRLGQFRSRCLNVARERILKAEEEQRRRDALRKMKNRERNRRLTALAKNTKAKIVEDDWNLDKSGKTPMALQKMRGLAMYFRWSRIVRRLLDVVHIRNIDADWNLDPASRSNAKAKFGKLFMAMRWQSFIAKYLKRRKEIDLQHALLKASES